MAGTGALNNVVREVRIAFTDAPTLRERLLYKADDGLGLTRTTEVRSSYDASLISRHSVSGLLPGTGNTALPVAPRLTLPSRISQGARQRILDAVAELRDAAPSESLPAKGDLYEYPPKGELWVDTQASRTPRSNPWIGQRFSTSDPQVAKLMDALHSEQLGRSRFDFHGGDGQAVFV